MLTLLDCVLTGRGAAAAPFPRAAVIGICKNAGKTVALNRLIEEATDRGVRLAVLSSGRDGEARDAVTELPKPCIRLPAGTWLVTARDVLTPAVEACGELPLATPLGPVVLGRMAAACEAVLVSPGSSQRLATALTALAAAARAAGDPPGLALIDGAFDRLAAAAPGLADAVVLAVGAAYSPSLKQTLAQAAFLLDVLRLPAAAPTRDVSQSPAAAPTGDGPQSPALDWAPDVLDAAFAAAKPALLLPGAPEPLPLGVDSALSEAGTVLRAVQAALEGPQAALVLPGALGDGLLQAMLGDYRHLVRRLALVLPDPTHVLASRELWRRWRRMGGTAAVRRPVQVAAVTANPHSPVGASYDPGEFFTQLCGVAAGLPVFDLVHGLQCTEGSRRR